MPRYQCEWVRRSPPVDVVNLAPGRGNTAFGDGSSAVADDDDSALSCREAALRGTEAVNAAMGIDRDELITAAAGQGGVQRQIVAPFMKARSC